MARNPNERQDRDWRDFHHPSMDYQAPKQLRRFRAGLALLVSTLLVAGAWTGLWFAASWYVQGQVDAMAEAQAAQGGVLAYDAMDVAGYPSRITLTFAKPRYVGLMAGRTVEWRGETLTLSTRPWMPWRLRVEAPGRHELEQADGRLILTGSVAKLGADVVVGGAWPERLSVTVEGLDMSGGQAVAMDAMTLDLEHDASVRASGDGLKLKLSGAGWTLPLGGGWGLGNTVESVDLSLRVTGPVQPGNFAERLMAWRDVGGAIEFEQMKLRAGPLGVAAVGTLALDGEMQPLGAFTAKFEGLFQVLEILRGQGLVRDGDAVLATMALSALSRRPANGGPSAINLAVSVQDGKLSLGPVPVLALPKIDWGIAEAAQEAAPQEPARDYKDAPPVY